MAGIGDGHIKRHLVAFYEAVIPLFEKKGRGNRLMVRDKLDVIQEGLKRLRAGEGLSHLQCKFPSIYK
jgi:hypothetical protein